MLPGEVQRWQGIPGGALRQAWHQTTARGQGGARCGHRAGGACGHGRGGVRPGVRWRTAGLRGGAACADVSCEGATGCCEQRTGHGARLGVGSRCERPAGIGAVSAVEVLDAGGRSGGRAKGRVDRLVVGVRESQEQDDSWSEQRTERQSCRFPRWERLGGASWGRAWG